MYDSEIEVSEKEDVEEYAIKEYNISASPNDFNIITLVNFIESGALFIPGFQRNYVWDITKASKLIESILMGLPIPQIFLYEEDDNKFLVIDGQQRLMSIYYFVKQRFPLNKKRVELRKIFEENGKIPDQMIEDDAYFKKFNLSLSKHSQKQKSSYHGLNYSTLNEHKVKFDMRTIRNVIVKQNLPEKDNSSVFEIFNRLNSGGINLKPQEIRACMYHSKFYDMLFKINNNERWRKLLSSNEADLHSRDVEIILKCFAMLIDGNNYKPSMRKFLDNFSGICKEFEQNEVDYLKKLFESFLEATADLPEKIFIGSTGRFATLFFEAVFAAVCQYPFSKKEFVVYKLSQESIYALFKDKKFIKASQSETSSTTNVKERLNIAYSIING